jgi:CheY-like chemotaxis protein
MQQTSNVPDDFVRMVRSALAHLYDYAYLQNHPLAFILSAVQSLDHVTRAQKVRRALLDCIEVLKPSDHNDAQTDLARSYAILTYRYVSGYTILEIAGKLALSERQTYREHEKGVVAVASVLWDMTLTAGGTNDQASGPVKALQNGDLANIQAEVDRLRQSERFDPLDLLDTFKGVLATLAPLTSRTNTQFTISTIHTGSSIIADRVMLRQALLNLLRFTLNLGQGDIEITISQANANLHIEIDGALKPGEGPVEFAVTSTESEVGFAVAKALVEAQGGKLQVMQREGRWHIQLSLHTAGKIVLVVDDNADLVALFQRYLGGHDVTVVGAIDGEQAIRLAAELEPQLITLDVMMPQQDGWEVLQKLKSTAGTKNIPIVICSVLHESQLALATGASDYITKPVSQVDLLRLLQRWLGPLQPTA